MAATAPSILAPRPVTPVSLVAARLARLVRELERSGVDPDLLIEAREVAALASGLDPYVEACTTPESPALAELTRRTRATDWASAQRGRESLHLEQEMLSGHVEGQLLKFLVHATGARRILEIGLFTGYSALAMAEALPDDGELIACEIDPAVAALAQECVAASPAGRSIDIRVGPALATLAELAAAGERFDLVFIDADKGGYGDYVQCVLDDDLLTEGGVICIDNTLMQGQPWVGAQTPNGTAIEVFNRALAADPRVEQVLVPLRDGLTLVRRA